MLRRNELVNATVAILQQEAFDHGDRTNYELAREIVDTILRLQQKEMSDGETSGV